MCSPKAYQYCQYVISDLIWLDFVYMWTQTPRANELSLKVRVLRRGSKMRKSSWIILLLFVAIGAPTAHADSYSATFTCTGVCYGYVPTAPDVTFPTPNFTTITYDGDVMYDLTISNSFALPTDTYYWVAQVGVNPSMPDTLDMCVEDVTLATYCFYSTIIGLSGALPQQESGSLVFSAVATPEPSSVAFMLGGIGFVLVMRKRAAQDHPQGRVILRFAK